MALTVTIDKESEERIDRLIEAGRYSDVGELIRAALRLVDEREQTREERLLGLREEIQKGFDSGPGREVDPDQWGEEIKARGMTKLAATR